MFLVERRTVDGAHRAVLVHKRYRPTKVSTKGESPSRKVTHE